MTYRVKLPEAVRQTLAELPPTVKQEVKGALRFLSRSPYGGEPLRLELSGKWKMRVGHYRIIYEVHPTQRTLLIHAIGHRRDIYQTLI